MLVNAPLPDRKSSEGTFVLQSLCHCAYEILPDVSISTQSRTRKRERENDDADQGEKLHSCFNLYATVRTKSCQM